MATCRVTRVIGLKVKSDYFDSLPFELTCMLEENHRGQADNIQHKEGKATNHRMVLEGIAAIYWQDEEVKDGDRS